MDLQEPPYAFVQVQVQVQGVAELSEDLSELVRTATAIGVRYMGPERAEEFGKRNGVPGELVVPGKGLGFVDVYNVNGVLIKHLVAHGPLDEPWGLAIAPKGFGPFGGQLLVGNLGNGWINAFNPTTGKYLGALDTTSGHPIAINGLWALMVGNSRGGGW